jgi:signal transduction histidine kinase
VLWLMNQSIHNQRLLVRQKLTDAYRTELLLIRDRLNADWAVKAATLDAEEGGAAAFARIMRSGLADSAILLDASGASVYPVIASRPGSDSTLNHPAWDRAQQLEESDPAKAALAYRDIAATLADAGSAARALQAQARCLLRAGQPQAAAQLVAERFAGRRFDEATDSDGRLIAVDELLMAVHFSPPGRRAVEAAQRLRERLLDYQNLAMPSAQRLFAMREMQALGLPPEMTDFPSLKAEELALRFLEVEPRPRGGAALQASALPGIWKLTSSKGKVVALYRLETLQNQMHAFLMRQSLESGTQAEIAAPGMPVPGNLAVQAIPGGERLPGWQLALTSAGKDPFEEQAARQLALNWWIGALLVTAVAALAVIAARLITRSLGVAGMKADLAATVSHELKTPLTSMRVLVDTLLDEPELDSRQTRDYLALIARENARLSRVIENFLAFSRMERKRYRLEFLPVRPEDVVRQAIEAAGERFREPGCHLAAEVEPGLPEIEADENALVTVLLNLLDNAHKYTPEEKRIALRVFAADGEVCFEVRDNGVGIGSGEIKRIFRQFYQSDRRLARAKGGCGLGLAIVQYLVDAHGGTVRVASEPGKGSAFTVALKASV